MRIRLGQQKTGSPFKVTLLFLVYGAIHSLLASGAAKRAFANMAGERARNGLYRPFYNAQAVLGTIAALMAFQRFPDRSVYRVRKPWSWALNLVQLSGVLLLLRALSVTGFDRIIGLPQLFKYLRGENPGPENAAQGPPPHALVHPEERGPFAWVRHPENLAFVLMLWALPKMTVNRIMAALLATLYSVVGSWHEDARLESAYGEPFTRYRRSTPMLLPRLGFRKAK